MRRLPFTCSALALGLLAAWLPQARAADEKVKFETGDRVELRGTFYASDKPKKMPTVLMLHKVGGSSSEEGWDSLAQKLQEKGFAVLRFDLRGHGDSTRLADPVTFWSVQDNRSLVAGYNPQRPKDTISYKGFSAKYYPQLANDIAAAKLFLDKKNDSGECNSANLILIGAEDGATLGLLWMYSEWYRYRLLPAAVPGLAPAPAKDPEGKDQVLGIWLSMSSKLGGYPAWYEDWIRFVGREKHVPMTFIFGEKDKAGEALAKHALSVMKPAKTDKFTASHPIKQTKLTGNKLLSKSLETEEDILKALDDFVANTAINEWDQREAKKTAYAWGAVVNGVMLKPLRCKAAGEDAMNLLPFSGLGIRLLTP